MTRPTLSNRDARAVFLDRHGLLQQPTGPGKGADLLSVIKDLGFVQVDSVRTVERAHDMILFARRPAYRPRFLKHLLERDRALFEHWTHDAAVIPMAFHRHWRLKQARDAERLRSRWRKDRRSGYEAEFDTILAHIDENGPCGSADLGGDEPRNSGGWWDWHPSKTALEYLWRSGVLAVSRRDSFRKVYDRIECVVPEEELTARPDAETIDWLCRGALDRLGFATSGEIAAFWDIVSPVEAKAWCAEEQEAGRIEEIDVTCVDGQLRRSFARPELVDRASDLPGPPGRIRVLSPFDPMLRDRKRAHRLFGFHYRIEIFTPAPKRIFGYYVFPLLEGDRLIGRIDMKADRANRRLVVTALWPEPGLKWTNGRQKKLEAELDRLARFSDLTEVQWPDALVKPFPATAII